jgi:hypothetical protein
MRLARRDPIPSSDWFAIEVFLIPLKVNPWRRLGQDRIIRLPLRLTMMSNG